MNKPDELRIQALNEGYVRVLNSWIRNKNHSFDEKHLVKLRRKLLDMQSYALWSPDDFNSLPMNMARNLIDQFNEENSLEDTVKGMTHG